MSKFFNPSGRKGRKEHVMTRTSMAAIAAVLSLVVSTAQAQTAPAVNAAPGSSGVSIKCKNGTTGCTVSGLDLGLTPVMPNQCTKRLGIPEVKAAEQTNCKAGGGSYVVTNCFCDLSSAKGLAAFCHLDTDTGSARAVHKTTECEAWAATVGTRWAAYHSVREIDGDPACRRLAANKYAKGARGKKAKARDLKACKNKGLKAAVAVANDQSATAKKAADQAEADAKAIASRLALLETASKAADARIAANAAAAKKNGANIDAIDGVLSGGDEAACNEVKALIAAGKEVPDDVLFRCEGLEPTVRSVYQKARKAQEQAQTAAAAAKTLKKGFRMSFGLDAGAALSQPEVKADGKTLRGGNGAGAGPEIGFGIGKLRFNTQWTRVAETGGSGTTWGNRVAFRAVDMAWGSDAVKFGLGGGLFYAATGQAPSFDPAHVAGLGLEIDPALEWQPASHFVLTVTLPISYQWDSAQAPGGTDIVHADGAGIGLDVGISVPIPLF